MLMGSIARRYAKALFGLAIEQDRVEAWSDALVALQAAVDASPDLQDVLGNPVYSKEQRREIVKRLASALRLDADPTSLLLLLADRNRLGHLEGLVRAFRELADTQLGRLRAQVTTAVPLDAAAEKALAERLAKATRTHVIVERSVDPALLGGVVARVGSTVYDGSIKSQLEALRRELKQR
jgi:F-type H+-transporting ATPase subunit delta